MKVLNEPTDAVRGEAAVLGVLKQIDQNWTVVCELNLPRKGRGNGRRIDFLVVAPGYGLLVLEIKGSPDIRFENGRFHAPPSPNDPLIQLHDQKSLLRERCQNLLPNQRLIIAGTLGFPFWIPTGSDGDLLRRNPGNHLPWETLFSDSFLGPTQLKDAILEVFRREGEKMQTSGELFGEAEASALVDSLLPSATGREDVRVKSAHFVRSLDGFTDKQRQTYELYLLKRPKVLVTGPYGTGKTYLAQHIAARMAQDFGRVAIVVRRNELKLQIKSAVASISLKRGSVDVLTIDQVAREMGAPAEPEELALALIEAKDQRGWVPYDALVIDQAEDFINSASWVDAILELVKDGSSGQGRIKIFGDFEYQAKQPSDEVQKRLVELGFDVLEPLTECLRNGRDIAKALEKVAGREISTGYLDETGLYEEVLFRDELHPVLREQYPVSATWYRAQALLDKLREIRELGYAPGDVVVLTALPRKADAGYQNGGLKDSSPGVVGLGSEIKVSESYQGEPDVPMGYGAREHYIKELASKGSGGDVTSQGGKVYYWGKFKTPLDYSGLSPEWRPKYLNSEPRPPSGVVTWCTVEEFRGCERLVVILTDADMLPGANWRKQATQAGISRALERCYLIVAEGNNKKEPRANR